MISQIESVDVELQQWERSESDATTDGDDVKAREARDRRSMRERLNELRRGAMRLRSELEHSGVGVDPAAQARLERLVRAASNQASDLFVIQTQVRTYLIELQTIEVSEPVATNLALSRRLDLKNERAMVVDSWRKIRVAQDGLEADLNLFAEADIATQPRSTNPVDFSSDASSYRVGVAFDGPLNRLAERNIYRAELINYQRSRRDLIGLRDSIVQAVRRDLRALEAEQLNFEISRQSLVAAARQVEQARLELLSPDQAGDSSTTQDALNALNSLLAAQNSLIASWVAYETARYQLLLDIESLELDQYGQIGEDDRVRDTSAGEASQPEPAVAHRPTVARRRANQRRR
jgi:hypothetical protein